MFAVRGGRGGGGGKDIDDEDKRWEVMYIKIMQVYEINFLLAGNCLSV